MSKLPKDRLYNLMPAVYRIHDSKNGEPLRALLGVIEDEARSLEEDIGSLYDNWFIETCDEWVIHYIADLLNIKDLRPLSGRTWSLRSYVANTLAYRRRKGSVRVLEQVARDVTGWPAHAAEISPLVSTTQHLNCLRPQKNGSFDLKKRKDLTLIGGPFESSPHTVEVCGISGERKYSPFKVGLFLWRLQSMPIRKVTASNADGVTGGYRFDPTGRDIPLFNQPQTETRVAHISEEANLPGRLSRRSLQEDLELLRRGKPRGISFFSPNPVISVSIIEEKDILEIPPHDVFIGDLTRWNSLPQDKDFWTRADPSDVQKVRLQEADFVGSNHWQPDSIVELIKPGKEKVGPGMMARILMVDEDQDEASLILDRDISAAVEDGSVLLRKRSVLVDPELGRLVLSREFGEVLVSYSCGFSADIGAGPWDRSSSVGRILYRSVDWQVGVSREHEANGKTIFSTLAEAAMEWKKQPEGSVGVIAFMDSRTYSGDVELEIAEGSQLLIIAADWPFTSNSGSKFIREAGNLAASGVRPHLKGNIRVKGRARLDSSDPGELALSGLLIEGRLTVAGGNLGGLTISHCTLVPAETSLEVLMEGSEENDSLRLVIDMSICGSLCLPGHLAHFEIEESIIDGMGSMAVNAPGAVAQVEKSTILGRSELMALSASDSIFTDRVVARQKNIGCIRFCYLPAGSRTPRRFRCLPELAMEAEALRQKLLSSEDLPEREHQRVEAKTRPAFTSLRYGDPGYCQLSLATAQEVRNGAENGSEMGAFNSLQHHQRRANLRAALKEYMRFGMEAGLFFQT